MATMESNLTRTPATSPSPNCSPSSAACSWRLAARSDRARQGEHHEHEGPEQDRHATTTQAVTTAGPGLEDRGLGGVPPTRQQGEERGTDPVVEVRHAGDVGEHVVAVEAHQRRQLPQHLQHLGGDDQQDRVPPARPPHAEHHDRHDGVEVQPAEVGAHAAGAAEAVAVTSV